MAAATPARSLDPRKMVLLHIDWSAAATAPIDEASHCNPASPSSWLTSANHRYVEGALSSALYNHHFPPNHEGFDCVMNFGTGYKSARSYHGGVVNTLLGDGSVRGVKNSVSLAVWRGLATRNGGEVLSADSF